jgi:predicted RNA-binding protein with EMAP domain
VALGGCHQSLGATDGEFEDGESAVRVVAGEQEADRQHTEVDGLVGGVDAENDV